MKIIKIKRKYIKSDKLNCKLILTIFNICEITVEDGKEILNFYQIYNLDEVWDFEKDEINSTN